MRAIITGISGFVGSHIAKVLAASDGLVVGIARDAESDFRGDITDGAFLRETFAATRPTHVFHCAGVLGDAGAADLERTNVTGTALLLEAVRVAAPEATVIITGSSAVYGRPARLPVREDDPLDPLTDYARSKAGQEKIAVEFGEVLRVIRLRLFNIVGPRQPASLVTSSLARQIARCERGLDSVVRVGNRSSRRDYCDVRDAARAHVLLATQGTPGEVYNVCTGRSRSVQEAIDILLRHARAPITMLDDERLLSRNEIGEQRGSWDRLRAATGWRPEIDFETSLADLLDDWRCRVEREGSKA